MIIDSCSWKRDYSSYGGSYWNKEWMLTDSAKQIRRNKIAEYNKKIAELENAKKKRREQKKRRSVKRKKKRAKRQRKKQRNALKNIGLNTQKRKRRLKRKLPL